MKRSLHIANAACKLLTSKQSMVFKCPKYFLSTQTNGKLNRGLKASSERKSIWENTVPNVMLNRDIKTAEDWQAVRSALINSGKQITPITIDSVILNYCIASQNYTLGFNYMEFLRHENLRPNLAAMGKYFKLFYLSSNDETPTKTEAFIFNMYKDLRKAYKVLDASTCENIIHALSITDQWKECLKLLEEIKIACDPSISAYSLVAAAAFKNNENELAWKLLEEVADKGRNAHSVAYLSYLEQYEQSLTRGNVNFLEKLFEFYRLHDIRCDAAVARKISNTSKKLNLNARTAVITTRGVCLNCKQKLDKLELNEQQFDCLKAAVLENVIVGKNVFYRTTPAELKRFQEFIAGMRKYDVVIDGLNVAYSIGTRQSSYTLSSLLAAVVRHFVEQKKSILVLGRTHMQNWPKSNWLYVKQNADTFLAQTLSQDDPYLLYCALNCGLNTIIVSRDLMRSHMFKLHDPKLKLLFSHWLMLSQHPLQFVNNQGKAYFKYPPQFTRTAQKVGNSWHIPYDEPANSSNSNVENKWLCLNI